MAQGRDTITQRVGLEGDDDVKKRLDDIGKHGDDAFKKLDNAAKGSHGSLTTFVSRVSGALGGLRSFGESVSAAGERFGRLREAGNRFNESLRQTTDTIFPHFAEIVPAGVAAVTAGFLELAKHAAEGVRETQNLAAALGLAVEDLEGLRLVAAKAGVSQDALSVGLARFAQSLGQAREEHAKLTGQLDSGVKVLRGGAHAVEQSSAILRGGVDNANKEIFNQTAVLRGGHKATLDFSNAYKALGIDVGDFRDNSHGNILALQELATRLDKLGDSTIKARVAQQVFSRGWREILPAFTGLAPALTTALNQIRQFGTGVEAEERRQSTAFLISYETMKEVVARVGEIFGNIFGQVLTPIFDGITALLTSDLKGWKQWADGIVEGVVPRVRAVVDDLSAYLQGKLTKEQLKTDFAKDLIGAFQKISVAAAIAIAIIEALFQGLSFVLAPVAAVINRLFGTEFTGDTLAVAAAILYLTGTFRLLGSAIGIARAAFLAFGSAPALIILSFAAFFAYFYQHWDEVKGLAKATWDLIVSLAVYAAREVIAVWTGVEKWWNDAVAAIGKAWNDYIIDPIVKGFDLVIYWALYFIGLIEKGLAKASTLFGGGVSEGAALAPQGYAGGGDVRGPAGTDRVLIRATAGEFMMRAAAVRHWGLNFFARLNRLENPLKGFAMGGLVGPSISIGSLAAAGGAAAGLFQIDLSHDGSSFRGLMGPREVAEALNSYSVGLQARRLGRRPSSVGG